MKKIIKKIKPKHLARFGLVMMLGCYIATFLCSATYTFNLQSVDLSDSSGDYSCVIFDSLEDNIIVNSSSDISLTYDEKYSTSADFICENGDIVSNDGTIIMTNTSVPDGYYNLVIGLFGEYVGSNGFYSSVYIATGEVVYSAQQNTTHISVQIVDSVPETVYINFDSTVESQSGFTEGDIIYELLLVPAPPPPPPQDTITNVWSDVLTWVTSSLSSVTGIFWNGSSLTLIGTLACVGTAVAICLLVYNKCKDFLNLQ